MSFDHEKAQAAHEARAVLESPAFKNAADKSRTLILEAIAATAPDKPAQREFLYTMIRTLPFVEMALSTILNDGAPDLQKMLDTLDKK